MTAPACIGEPISWLRLEQLALAELAAPDADAARAHLATCAACTAALDRITADTRPLPRLPASARSAAAPASHTPWWRRWQLATGGLALATAALVLLLVQKPDAPPLPANAARVKGAGVVIVTLVRDRAGVISFDPRDVAPADRWKLQLTCDPGGAAWVDVAVIQAGQTFYPLTPTRITCGNAVVVPGAFRITDGGADLCVALSATPPDRPRLSAGDRHGTVCTTLTAAPP